MGLKEWIWGAPQAPDTSVQQLLDFMAEQSRSNNDLIRTVLSAAEKNADTLKSYIELFKPQTVPSTNLQEREQMRTQDDVWSAIDESELLKSFSSSDDLA